MLAHSLQHTDALTYKIIMHKELQLTQYSKDSRGKEDSKAFKSFLEGYSMLSLVCRAYDRACFKFRPDAPLNFPNTDYSRDAFVQVSRTFSPSCLPMSGIAHIGAADMASSQGFLTAVSML